MSRIIGVLNFKGGTAKTTTVVNLAAGLALRGARVLCLDLDPQGSLAAYLGVSYRRSLADLLHGTAGVAACTVLARANLDLIPGDRSLFNAEGMLWRMGNERAARMLLSERMQSVDGYDYIILDHSPSTSLLSESALLYANELMVPVAMTYLALVGARQVIDSLRSLGRISDHRAQLGWIVPTFYYERLRKDRAVMGTLRQHFGDRVTDPIRANVKLAEAPSHQQSIYEYAPSSTGAADYALLVERIAQDG